MSIPFRLSSGYLIGIPATIFLCISTLGFLQVPQLNELKAGAETKSLADINQDLQAEELQLSLLQEFPNLGFENLIAKWAFLRFLQYFGDDEVRAKTGYNLSPEYFETILERDPNFIDGYLFLSGSTTLYAGMPERTVELMNQKLAKLSPDAPKSYHPWRYKGTDELLFLGDYEAAQRSFDMAADLASGFSDPESEVVVSVSRRTAQFLAQNPTSKSAQVSAWSTILNNAFDDETRKLAINQIKALGGQVMIDNQGRISIGLPEQD
ncbi:MAG: hypothetical protein F6K19_27510 [Cyanothece sp. SIO1E1]|nr:hypothetical protein [Cyanothece sp. SIO1E1]